MKSITIDRNKRLKEEPHLGHNRWHPDISPIVEVDVGEEVVLETRDASDCQIKPGMTVADAVIIGSSLKEEGVWWNPVSRAATAAFMEVVRQARAEG